MKYELENPPKTRTAGLRNFVAMIANELEAGNAEAAKLLAIDLWNDIGSAYVCKEDGKRPLEKAAPDLLEAAKEVIANTTENVLALGYDSLDAYFRTGPDPDPLTGLPLNPEPELKLLAAIAKAEGRAA